mmetsp:Transcript_2202/g.6522  ORF Transcript_2202/g.6522 Transcript_2202/m.6522 type:complete len:381 (+) Transcript_2202:190-1332(+)
MAPPSTNCTTTDGHTAEARSSANGEGTYESVQNYYGKVLSTSKDLKTSACTASGRPHPEILRLIQKVPAEINEKFYGCGAPIPLGISGRRVLDLGSGSGRDCYVAAALVGESGFVTGVDMTDEQLAVSQKYVEEFCQTTLGYAQPNMKFVKGFIEYLDQAGIEDESQDLVISNCVVNLSPDKPRVISEAYRVLAPGGELFFSDVYCDRRLPEEVQKHEVLWGECISGAMYMHDFEREARKVGFVDPRMLSVSRIDVHDPDLRAILGEAKFYSITYRLFKLPGLLETLCEDYGQYAVYKGTIKGMESGYQLDDHHRFVKGKPLLICGNSAAMVGEGGVSWLSPHFEVFGDRSIHYGLFDGCGAPAFKEADPGACVAGGSCC